jgi:hypothetical protein
MMAKSGQKILHMTFHKCGSQWVRDVLTSPEIVAHSSVGLGNSGVDLQRETWPAQDPGTLVGPVYNGSAQDWLTQKETGQKAVVVLRDPRDRLVSMMYSYTYSHTPNNVTAAIRGPLLSLSERDRLLTCLFDSRHIEHAMRSWAGGIDDSFVTKYESLSADALHEFAAIVDFLEWNIPPEVLAAAVSRHSFENRSGRKPGDINIHSHYRSGVAAGWRQHFDRDLGRLFEALFPELLSRMGYEEDCSWFEALPAAAETLQAGEVSGEHEARAEVTRMAEKLHVIEMECQKRGTVIEELQEVAQQRLQLIEELDFACKQLRTTEGAG